MFRFSPKIGITKQNFSWQWKQLLFCTSSIMLLWIRANGRNILHCVLLKLCRKHFLLLLTDGGFVPSTQTKTFHTRAGRHGDCACVTVGWRRFGLSDKQLIQMAIKWPRGCQSLPRLNSGYVMYWMLGVQVDWKIDFFPTLNLKYLLIDIHA